jgi:hypothetical protein
VTARAAVREPAGAEAASQARRREEDAGSLSAFRKVLAALVALVALWAAACTIFWGCFALLYAEDQCKKAR